MMRRLTILALAVVAMAGCAKEESVAIDDSLEVKFSAGSITRVSSDSDGKDCWEAKDEIGINAYNLSGSTSDYINVMYTADKAGETTTFSSTDPILYPNVSSKSSAYFYAYYPYDKDYGSDNPEITVDVSGQKGDYGSVDFMTAQVTGVTFGLDENNNNPIAFEFNHKLTKVVISVSTNDNLSSLKGLTTTISGVYGERYYGIRGVQNTTSKPAATTSFDITSVVVETKDSEGAEEYKSATVTAILHPMTVADINDETSTDECPNAKLTFVVDEKNSAGEKKSFTVGFNYALVANTIYNYSIKLGNDYVMFDGASTISDWSKYDEGNTTELVPTETTATE